ncbi:hypothetical protein [Dyella subtropica]|uniref:hypothetical protein n=1 Tax=Dyella subtropica TaxID=2992127 RepID=UPI0022546C67|nr:hypothetical protein [Dyella subtropica]
MKTLLMTLALAAGLTHAGHAAAVGRMLDLSVYDRTSQRSLPVYQHDGRYYIAGQPGHRYQVSLRSRSGDDVLAVLSVDAVNAISGETADWSQTGYVLNPYENTDVLGWRKSLTHVADFVFADFAQSYAVRTGRPDNVGVIGVAVFRRQPAYVPMQQPIPMRREADAPVAAPPAAEAASRYTAAAQSAPAAALAKAEAPLGTGHGQREYSAVNYVDFKRASSTPDEVITLYYDTWEHLRAQGVVPPAPPRPGQPEPFPGHFVPDP